MTPPDDPRWPPLLASGALDAIAFDAPDAWPHGPRMPGEKTKSQGADSLSANYCTLQGHRFVAARLVLPVIGVQNVLSIRTWGSISDDSYAALLAARTGASAFEGCFAWAANALPGFTPGAPLGCNLLPGRPGQSPLLYAQSGPVAEAQKTGLSLDRLLEILAAAGQDLPITPA